METSERYAHIPGWGVDLDHANRPAYPKERTPPRLEGVHREPLPGQQETVKVYHSTERPGLTPVFGTTVPPSGLSGLMRGYAFRHSENDLRHWLVLLAADRVNMFEGIAVDLRHGHVPNLFAEMGLASELRYNRRRFVRNALIGTLAFTLAMRGLRRMRKH